MKDSGKTYQHPKGLMTDVRSLEGMIDNAISRLCENFPDGNCTASFKLQETGSVGAMSLTGKSGEYELNLSVLKSGPEGACDLRTCCPVRGNRKEISRFLRSEQAKKQLTDRMLNLLCD